ncbi:MAG: cyanophycin synthetase, partial [Bacteroidia bacterium]
GRIVLNADDEQLVAGAIRNLADETEVIWFSLDSDSSLVAAHLEAGGRAVVLDGEMICLRGDWPAVRGPSNNVASVKDIPMTLGGAARYNVSNALAAVAIAADAAIDIRFIAAGLGAFESDADQNPGRLNEFHFDGIQVLVDFAHNPGGMAAFFGLRKHLNPKRALFSIGQAGDRDEKSTRSMTRTAWEAGPDLLVLKELTLHLRGRELGELPAIMESELNNLGAPTDSWCHAPNELASVHMALEWAQPGDLLMLLAHDSRDEILELLAARQAASKDPV